MRLNKKGFTLVELLVVIVILGIITGISIPLIRNIQASNEMRKYTTYMDSLKVSAKLYVDSYGEDLFGHSSVGCALIHYSQLEDKGLLKDIALGDVSCKNENTLIRVVKIDDKISYTPMISCGSKKTDGTINVETQLPEEGIGDLSTCRVDSNTIISFSTTPASSNSINYKKRNITVKASSFTGFHEDLMIYYSFIQKENKPSDENTDPSSHIIDGWKRLNVDYIGGKEQKIEIANGNAVTLSSEFTTPNNQTGDYYVVLKVDSLKDLAGRNWKTESGNSQYVYLGSFRIDNTKPVFGDSSTVISSASNYNDLKPKLKISVTDNYSNADNLRMCTSYDTDTCLKTVKDIKNKNGYVNYDGNKVLDKIQNNYDGSSHTVYVTVGDAAGNYETKSYTYKLATRYTLTYDSNGGNACDPSSKSVTFDSTNPKWGTLCSPTRTNYTFTGWNTKRDGSGNTVTSDTTASGNTTVYAQWRKNQVIFQYKILSGETLTSPTTYTDGTVNNWSTNSNGLLQKNGSLYIQKINFDASTMDLINYNYSAYVEIKKTGYHGVSGSEWKCDGGCKTSGMTFSHDSTSVTPSNICDYSKTDCTVTLKVNWTTTSYTISYTLNGGSVSPANKTSYNVTTDTFTLNNPSKNGYSFNGWTGTGLSDASTSVSIPKGSTGDRAYSANWTPVTYTITYNLDGGSLASGVTNPTSYTIESNAITLNNPTKAEYHFAGWTGTDLSSASTSVTISKGSTGNKSYTANWYDTTPPTCTTSKSNTESTDGVTVSITCSDSGSGCSSSNTLSYTGVKSDQTYTVYDNEGNSGSCSVSVSSYTVYRSKTRTCSEWKSCNSYSHGTCGGGAYCTAWATAGDPHCYACGLASTCCGCKYSPTYGCWGTSSACGCKTYNDWGSWGDYSTTVCTSDDYTDCETQLRYQ